jgi:hypothetical protein
VVILDGAVKSGCRQVRVQGFEGGKEGSSWRFPCGTSGIWLDSHSSVCVCVCVCVYLRCDLKNTVWII